MDLQIDQKFINELLNERDYFDTNETYYCIVDQQHVIDLYQKDLTESIISDNIQKDGYFFTDINTVLDFIANGEFLLQLKVPSKNHELVVISVESGWKSNMILMDSIYCLDSISTIEFLYKKNIDHNKLVSLARKYLNSEMLDFLIDKGLRMRPNLKYISDWATITNNPLESRFNSKLISRIPFLAVTDTLPDQNNGICIINNIILTDIENLFCELSKGKFVLEVLIPVNEFDKKILMNFNSKGKVWVSEVYCVGYQNLDDISILQHLIALGCNKMHVLLFTIKSHRESSTTMLLSNYVFDKIELEYALCIAAVSGNFNVFSSIINTVKNSYYTTEQKISSLINLDLILREEVNLPVRINYTPTTYTDIILVLAVIGGSVEIICLLLKYFYQQIIDNYHILTKYSIMYENGDMMDLLRNIYKGFYSNFQTNNESDSLFNKNILKTDN